MLQLKDLNIGYKLKREEKSVLSNLNVVFDTGCLIALAGNNGTGKSTLLKTIGGVIKPLSGTIMLNRKDYTSLDNDQISKIISVVLTEKVGGFNLTVFDVVASGRIPYLNAFGTLKNEDVRIVNETLELVGIKNLSDALYEELSDGQKQKVLIAKSLVQQTPVILMDEPTAFLDYESRRNLFTLLKQLAKEQHKTIIVSSHDLEILFRNADQVLYLKPGNQYFFGEPSLIQKEILDFK